MSGRRIRRDDQVQALHDRRGVQEWPGVFIEAACQVHYRELDVAELLGSKPLLEAEEPHPRHARQWRESLEWHRALPIPFGARVALPRDADLEPGEVRAEFSAPRFDQVRLRAE